ncbi:hypothetical protein LB503_011672 [Fusarium chuoi]|nr:hypothetical protein LB503_011672 [Fusarium chuoi]
MQFYTIVSLFLAGTAFATPATSSNGYEACPSGGLFGNPQCCSLNLVGVLSGDCRARESTLEYSRSIVTNCDNSYQDPQQRQGVPGDLRRVWSEGSLLWPL